MSAQPCPTCAARDRAEWLESLRDGQLVLVRNGKSVHFRAQIDRTTKTQVAIGNLKFRRTDGRAIRSKHSTQPLRSYRNLVLVRDEKENV